MTSQTTHVAQRALPFAVTFNLLLLTTAAAMAQPKAPPPPVRYNVKLRYQIDTRGLVHVAQFDEMVAGLKKKGFEFNPKLDDLPPTLREDPDKNLLTGSVLNKNAVNLLDVHFVQTILLIPDTMALPKDPSQRVQVELELAIGFSQAKQLELVEQLRALLVVFGFEEMLGYDHHGFTGKPNTRLRGSIPMDQLETLLKDVRRQPSGWFAPIIPPEKLPEPIKTTSPILFTRVIADPEPPRPLKPPAPPEGRGDQAYEKIDAQLWKLIVANKPHTDDLRIEIILATNPTDESSWRPAISKTAPRFRNEGWLGHIVTGVFPRPPVDEKGKAYEEVVILDFDQIKAVAKLPFVSAVRLPQPALVHADPEMAFKGDNALALQKSGLEAYHKKGQKGKGLRLAVIDSDFRSWQEALDAGKLPKGTFLIDLTRERNAGLVPDPTPGDPDQLGHGTQCAIAAALAAPDATIILVRIDPAAPLMLKTAVEYMFGAYVLSPYLTDRHDELVYAKNKLIKYREQIALEHKIILSNYDDDKEMTETFGFLGPVAGWVVLPRRWLFAREAELAKAEKQFEQRQFQFTDYLKSIQALKGIDIVSCSLVWNDGYPLGARGHLTKWLDDKLRPQYVVNAAGKKVVKGHRPLWFQSAGNTNGQSWQGLFRDVDGNGVMEFASPGGKLPPGSWTPELNFLAWQPFQGEQQPELPAGTNFRVSLQWTEPHDPSYFFDLGEPDGYLNPLVVLQVKILRQRDPAGAKLSQDDFEEVARSFMLPQRLDNYPGSATYELFVDWTVAKPGRYAVRVEKLQSSRWILVRDEKTVALEFVKLSDLTSTGIRPLGAPTLPKIEKHWELRPRLFVHALGGTSSTKGRPVFRDFSTGLGNVGVPSDGRVLIDVGAANFDGKAEAFSAAGPPSGMELRLYPTAMAYDRLDVSAAGKKGPAFGTSLAAPFAAGTAAVMIQSGTSPTEFLEALHTKGKKEGPGTK
jgi:hypothetical protein